MQEFDIPMTERIFCRLIAVCASEDVILAEELFTLLVDGRVRNVSLTEKGLNGLLQNLSYIPEGAELVSPFFHEGFEALHAKPTYESCRSFIASARLTRNIASAIHFFHNLMPAFGVPKDEEMCFTLLKSCFTQHDESSGIISMFLFVFVIL